MRKIRLINPGESVIASFGLLMAACLLITLAGTAWWSARSQEQSVTHARLAEVRTIGELTDELAERLLANGDLPALRKLISEIAQRHDLSMCRIMLPDGSIIADADPTNVTAVRLPDRFPVDEWTTAPFEYIGDSDIRTSIHLATSDRVGAVLEIEASLHATPAALASTQIGIGAAGAVSLFLLLVLYRRARSRIGGVMALHESMLAFTHGESDESTLMLDESYGPAVTAWNSLLTERRDLRRAMSEREARATLGRVVQNDTELNAAFDALWTGVLILDDALNIKYLNGAAAMLLGTSRDECTGLPNSEVLPSQVVKALTRLHSGETSNEPSVEITRDGEGHEDMLRFTVRRARQSARENLLVVVEDVTQRYAADSARQSFVAQATHELRTPLTNVRMYVEQAIDEAEGLSPALATCLNVINQESQRLERTVADMLSIAEIEAASFSLGSDDVAMGDLLRSLERDFAPQAKAKSIELVFDVNPKMPVIQGDREKVTLVMHNLLGNAIKYTPSGGSITVRADIMDGIVTIGVTDSGIGIDESERERVFEKFYRVDHPDVRATTGSGLGLALAREIARRHGGDIEVDSQLGRGSTFTLALPVPRSAIAA